MKTTLSAPTPKTFRDDVAGSLVLAAHVGTDGLGLVLSGGWSVSIWCHWSITFDGVEAPVTDAFKLVGKALQSFENAEGLEHLQFSGQCEVVANPANRERPSSEAMALRGPHALIVVWND